MRKNEIDNLTTKIPYYGCLGDVCVLSDGTLFAGFSIAGLDSLSMTEDQIGAAKGKFKHIFDHLPPGYVVQIFHDFHHDNRREIAVLDEKLTSTHPVAADFKKFHINNLKNDASLKHVNVYVFVIKPSRLSRKNPWEAIKRAIAWLKPIGKRKEYRPEENILDTLLGHSEELVSQTKRCLTSFKEIMGIDGHMMKQVEIEKLIYKNLNPGEDLVKSDKDGSEMLHFNYFSTFMTMRERLTHTGIEEHSDRMKIGDKWHTVLTLKLPSRSTGVFDAEHILSAIDFEFYWSFNFKILNTAQKNASLELKQKRKHAITARDSNPNASSIISKSEIEEAITSQKKEGFHWYEMSLSFVIMADDEETLKNRTVRLKSIFKDFHESILIEEKYAQLLYFVASLPGCGHLNDRRFLFSSLNVADLSPISTPPAGTLGLSCYFHTYRDTPFRFSTFSDEFNDWNQVVIGKIGSGKSFTVNSMLTRSLMAMAKPYVMILDLGQSFKRTTELWGGDYMTIDLNNPDSGLNPLPSKSVIYKEGEIDLDLLDFTVSLILQMAGMTSQERLCARVLRKTILYTYKTLDHDPIMSDLHASLLKYHEISPDAEDETSARKLAKLIEDYIGDGPYAKIFNRHSTLGFQSNFFCFDFKNASQNTHIREIATYVVGGMISRKMMENSEQKLIIFDEFASTMQHETGAALCRMIAKNDRKHGTSLTCISQEVEDFLHNPAAQTVYQQSNYKWFLKLDDNLQKYREHLKLTPTDVDIINHLHTVKGHYAEVYLHYGDKKTLLKLKPDPLSYWVCTTDARDKLISEAYLKHYHDEPPLETLKLLAKAYPHGVLSDTFKTDKIFLNSRGSLLQREGAA